MSAQAGADESLQKARDFVNETASNTGVGTPAVSEGSIIGKAGRFGQSARRKT